LIAGSGAAGQRSPADFAVSARWQELVDDRQLLNKGDPIARLDQRGLRNGAGSSRRQPVRKFVALFPVNNLDFPGHSPVV